MFPVDLEIFKDVLDAVVSGDYTYSELLELRDKLKDVADYVERLLDEE